MAEQQGREGLEETDNGTMIRNTGEVALNVRFNYDVAASGSGAGVRSSHTTTARHYRLNANTVMPSDPSNAGRVPTRFACGVPATARSNGQCFNNDGVTAPVPYEAPSGSGDAGSDEFFLDDSLKAGHCLKIESGMGGNFVLINRCNRTVSVTQVGCPGERLRPLIGRRGYGGYATYPSVEPGGVIRQAAGLLSISEPGPSNRQCRWDEVVHQACFLRPPYIIEAIFSSPIASATGEYSCGNVEGGYGATPPDEG